MNLRVLIVAILGAALVGGGLLFFVVRPSSDVASGPDPAPAARAVEETPPAAAVPEAPAADRVVTPPAPVAAAPAPASAPEVGTLHITSDVEGARVFIDRQFIGRTPVTASNVSPGSRRLNVEAEGYDGMAETIEVAPGQRTIDVRLREVRLDLTMPVVHKHRLGSCRGQLVATPQGLRYETDNASDGFSVPLDALAAFQVDYLETNLKVSVRGGREYNFTEPEGNADRLFVFHRDVTNARDRLARGDTPAP